MKIISRAEAKALGLPRYYVGKECKYGHVSERLVCNAACVVCTNQYSKNYRDKNPLHSTHKNMLYRCYSDNSNNYSKYGGRGITVCDRWFDPVNGFDNFVEDMGERPLGCTLDRINNDGNYSPSNCRWADLVTQLRNTRRTKIKGEDIITVFTLRDRGWTHKDIGVLFGCTGQNIRQILCKREYYIEQGIGSCTKAAA